MRLSHPTRVPRVYKSLTSQTLSDFQILWEATCTLPAFTKPEHRNEVGCVGWPVEEAGAEPLGGKMLIWTFSSFVTSLTRRWDVCMLCKHSTQVHRCTQINNKKKVSREEGPPLPLSPSPLSTGVAQNEVAFPPVPLSGCSLVGGTLLTSLVH